MATYARMGTPVDWMNLKQLRFRNTHLTNAPTSLLTTAATMITTIKALQRP